MTSAVVASRERPALGPFAGRGLGWWGMIMAIITEGTIFALLLFAYFYLKVRSDHWPLGDIKAPELKVTSIRTVLLLGSSIPVQLAERAIARGRRGAFLAWTALTFALASVFMAYHVLDQVDSWKEYKPSTNAYGSIFYTIVDLHALHLAIGMAILAYLFFAGLGGRYSSRQHEQVKVGVLYWHFVDVVWIFVFSSLYLLVRV